MLYPISSGLHLVGQWKFFHYPHLAVQRKQPDKKNRNKKVRFGKDFKVLKWELFRLLHCEMKYNHLKLFGVLLFSKLCNFILVLKTSVNVGSNTPQSSSKEIFCNKALTSHKASRMQSKIKSKIKCHLMALLLRFNENSLSIF